MHHILYEITTTHSISKLIIVHRFLPGRSINGKETCFMKCLHILAHTYENHYKEQLFREQ